MLLCLIAEEGREDDGGTDDEKNGTDQHHEFLDDTFLTEVHLDVDLQTGVDDHDGGYGINEVEHIEHVLYFACNCTDNQNYVKSGKGKCSQNDTRIVLPMNEEKGCV